MAIAKLLFVLLGFFLLQTPALAIKKPYVVYMGAHSHGLDATSANYELATEKHHNFLESFLGSKEKVKDSIFYSYQKHINGFAAKLEEEEALAISKHPDVLSVFLDKPLKLHITRSWEFMGLERDGIIPPESIWSKANLGRDTIIATLDSGVWPESECFKDDGLGTVPSRWKGSCQNNTKEGVLCNRKLIGAKYFNKAYEADIGPINSTFQSPRDFEGHGTHTLSTIGCKFVPGANVFTHANGTAKGGSPGARLAVYKVCWTEGCYNADMLAAFDAAIHDGVDVLSLSVGGEPDVYIKDAMAIGAFHAVMNGITVICSAGNSGPFPGSATNLAPWILTVAASTIDRFFPSYVKLGNNERLSGRSLSPDYLPEKMYPLINAKDAGSTNATTDDAQLCVEGALDPAKVKGRIVACLRGAIARVDKGSVVKAAGGVGMILANAEADGVQLSLDAHFLPATHITYSDGVKVYSYINSTESPVAYITRPDTVYGVKPNPQMAEFSSRGPNVITPEILKPDITAPGVLILAAYSLYASPTDLPEDPRREPFALLSGTSMSCPHVSGVVGLLKTLHPDWSSAAIRSAIMTSARTRDNNDEPMIDDFWQEEANPFNYGAGHMRPNRAANPGLIYDITTNDYLNFMCGLGYNSTQLDVLRKHKCPGKALKPLDLNYPSITVPQLTDAVIVRRKVKNVGPPATYKARIQRPPGVTVVVEPDTLTFNQTGEEKSFKLVLWPKYGLLENYVFGKLIWSDGVHYVRSPISVSSDPMASGWLDSKQRNFAADIRI